MTVHGYEETVAYYAGRIRNEWEARATTLTAVAPNDADRIAQPRVERKAAKRRYET